ncbi:MAG TPA: monofunctional biosynthetic peptidoglycan transglycosylase [Verrucomicrobiae bacterium]
MALTATAKFLTASSSAQLLATPDPVLFVPLRWVLVAVALLEVGIATFLVVGRSRHIKLLVVLWLSAHFALYRVALWWVQRGGPCPCLGALSDTLPADHQMVDGALKAVLAYLFLGSLFFLARSRVTAAISSMSPKGRLRLKWAAVTLGCLLLFPPFQIGCVSVFHPPTTAPMALRWAKGKLTGVPVSTNSYRWRDLNAVAVVFQKSVVAGEDDTFFEHGGFNWEQIRLAIGEAAARKRPPRGASTITQQCARSVFLWQGRSWIRKGLEAYYAVWMELLLSKRRILELYVNAIELGDGVYGVEAGARHHYGISAQQLTADQAAMLAAILPSPKKWNPNQPPERVRQWQGHILARVHKMPWPLAVEQETR